MQAHALNDQKNDAVQHDNMTTPANTKSWFTMYIFGIGHPCFQLATVKTRYLVTSITDHIVFSGLELIRHSNFWPKLTAGKVRVLIWSQAKSTLTCNESRVVLNPFNGNPGFKINRRIFSWMYKNVFHCFCAVWGYSNTKERDRLYKQKSSPQCNETQIQILA